MQKRVEHKKRIIGYDLLLDMLAEGGCIKTPIKGNSMLPFIVGDRDEITLVKSTAKSLQKGRIVVARVGEDKYYLHRIVEVAGDVVTLRGDGNPYQRENCHSSLILAEAVALHRKGKIYTPDSFAWKAAQRLWPSSPLLRRILLAIYRRIRMKNRTAGQD